MPDLSIDQSTARHRLLQQLHRGGVYAHLWTDAGNRSHWFRVDRLARPQERRLPDRWIQANVYFSVHPLARVPPHNAAGNRDRRYIASQLPYIAAVNTLFAEYDGKDYVRPMELLRHLAGGRSDVPAERRLALQAAQEQAFYAAPGRYKRRAWTEILALPFLPSVIVDSGGGYHCYWLLRNAVPVDETNRTDLQRLQQLWVQMVGGDPGASDLRRLLRLPGTFNRKPGFGVRSPRVSFVKADFDQLYDLGELEEATYDWLYARSVNESAPVHRSPVRPQAARRADAARATFNRSHSIVNLLIAHGYTLCYNSGQIARLARPGRGRRAASVTVFAATDRRPELAIHFSTNDPLYSVEWLDPNTGRVRRRAHDALDLYMLLERKTKLKSEKTVGTRADRRTNQLLVSQ